MKQIKELSKFVSSKDEMGYIYSTLLQAYGSLSRRDDTLLIDHAIRSANNFLYFVSTCDIDMDLELVKNCYIALLMHDILEDTDMTEEVLLNRAVPKEVVEIVKLLTKDKSKCNTFARIFTNMVYSMRNLNDTALLLKLCDRLDNTTVKRNQMTERRLNEFNKFTITYLLQTKEILGKLKNKEIILIDLIMLKIEKELCYHMLKEYLTDDVITTFKHMNSAELFKFLVDNYGDNELLVESAFNYRMMEVTNIVVESLIIYVANNLNVYISTSSNNHSIEYCGDDKINEVVQRLVTLLSEDNTLMSKNIFDLCKKIAIDTLNRVNYIYEISEQGE